MIESFEEAIECNLGKKDLAVAADIRVDCCTFEHFLGCSLSL